MKMHRRTPTVEAYIDLRGLVNELAEYLLFVGEAPPSVPLTPRPGFAERLESRTPKDRHGRSCGQLDLVNRLMRYPCSYMVYSAAFEGLSPAVKEAVQQQDDGHLVGERRTRAVRTRSRRRSACRPRHSERHEAGLSWSLVLNRRPGGQEGITPDLLISCEAGQAPAERPSTSVAQSWTADAFPEEIAAPHTQCRSPLRVSQTRSTSIDIAGLSTVILKDGGRD